MMNNAPARALGRGGLVVGDLSFGGAGLGNLYHAVDEDVARGAVEAAWNQGIRYFDTAPHYGLGLSERRLGDALAGRERSEFILSTKVGRVLVETQAYPGQRDIDDFDVPRSHDRVFDYSRDGVLKSIEESLVRMGLDRFDIVYVHDPDAHCEQALEGAFPALEELRAQGMVTSYGAGMNQATMLADFIRHTDLDVVMLAGRYTLFEQAALDELLPLASRRGVSVVAAGVFNSGLLAANRPTSNSHYDYAPASPAVIERVNLIADVCEQHGVTLPQAAAQFPLGHPAVSTVCLGARSAAQVTRNSHLFESSVPTSLWTALATEGLLRADAPFPTTSD